MPIEVDDAYAGVAKALGGEGFREAEWLESLAESDPAYLAKGIVSAVWSGRMRDTGYWERMLSLLTRTGLMPDGMTAALQGRLTYGMGAPFASRAAIYGMLAHCWEPPRMDDILDDVGLREAAPARWFDVLVDVSGTTDFTREVFLELLEGGRFRPLDLAVRIPTVMDMARRDPEAWLGTVVDAFPEAMRAEAEAVLIAGTGRVPALRALAA